MFREIEVFSFSSYNASLNKPKSTVTPDKPSQIPVIDTSPSGLPLIILLLKMDGWPAGWMGDRQTDR